MSIANVLYVFDVLTGPARSALRTMMGMFDVKSARLPGGRCAADVALEAIHCTIRRVTAAEPSSPAATAAAKATFLFTGVSRSHPHDTAPRRCAKALHRILEALDHERDRKGGHAFVTVEPRPVRHRADHHDGPVGEHRDRAADVSGN